MIKHILNNILAWLKVRRVFSLIKRQKVDYPPELRDKTLQKLLDKNRKM